MSLNHESKYPTRRAYVVKLRVDASAEAFRGRVENFVTGEQRYFTSGQELLDSIATDLAGTPQVPPAHEGPIPEDT